ncbi:MAG: sulfatase-like hydrolase/transferase [Planctomycetaceae bacterium]|nr:sulfatase-like hydrolase/transferase [Planctomycetaceae bacterium]
MWYAIFATIFTFSTSFTQQAHAAERPNVIWIVSEDNSHHYLRHFFKDGAPAPNIEAMAAHGVTFDHAFSNAPVCSVARSTLATGCLGPRIGTQFHRKHTMATLPDGLRMFSAYLRDAGYYTSNNSKTDYNATPSFGVWDESSRSATWRKRKSDDQPFFHMESHGQSHESSLHFSQQIFENEKTITDPASVKLADYFPDTEKFRYTLARYHDRIRVIDGIVGNTIARLKEDGLLEDTFVFYFGDHGGVLPRGKGYIYESGLHVPLVVRVPSKWKHLVDRKNGSRAQGFVSFIDFGPTVLNLASVKVPKQMDGVPFLGAGISTSEVETRDESFGYADRFDEKYEFIRSLRKGKYQYIRYFQPFLPDGLQNNYRYRMLAFTEWRDLFNAGKLSNPQLQFFQGKPVEQLFDTEADPHEVNNLANNPKHADVLKDLRGRLASQLRALPDLSFYPESKLVGIMNDPVGFGQQHKAEIAQMADVHDLALLPFPEAKLKLAAALNSDNVWLRYSAAMTCSAMGKKAASLASDVAPLIHDESLVVRIRATEFLGLINKINPQPMLAEIVNRTSNPVEAGEALNSIVYFRDCHQPAYAIDASTLKPKTKGDIITRRIDYLNGEPYKSNKRKKKPKKK